VMVQTIQRIDCEGGKRIWEVDLAYTRME
jgi:hypothetical protein